MSCFRKCPLLLAEIVKGRYTFSWFVFLSSRSPVFKGRLTDRMAARLTSHLCGPAARADGSIKPGIKKEFQRHDQRSLSRQPACPERGVRQCPSPTIDDPPPPDFPPPVDLFSQPGRPGWRSHAASSFLLNARTGQIILQSLSSASGPHPNVTAPHLSSAAKLLAAPSAQASVCACQPGMNCPGGIQSPAPGLIPVPSHRPTGLPPT